MLGRWPIMQRKIIVLKMVWIKMLNLLYIVIIYFYVTIILELSSNWRPCNYSRSLTNFTTKNLQGLLPSFKVVHHRNTGFIATSSLHWMTVWRNMSTLHLQGFIHIQMLTVWNFFCTRNISVNHWRHSSWHPPGFQLNDILNMGSWGEEHLCWMKLCQRLQQAGLQLLRENVLS